MISCFLWYVRVAATCDCFWRVFVTQRSSMLSFLVVLSMICICRYLSVGFIRVWMASFGCDFPGFNTGIHMLLILFDSTTTRKVRWQARYIFWFSISGDAIISAYFWRCLEILRGASEGLQVLVFTMSTESVSWIRRPQALLGYYFILMGRWFLFIVLDPPYFAFLPTSPQAVLDCYFYMMTYELVAEVRYNFLFLVCFRRKHVLLCISCSSFHF